MRLYVTDGEGRRVFVPLPTRLVFSDLSASVCYRYALPHLSKAHLTLTREQFIKLARELRRCRALLNGEPLVDVVGADGEKVKVYL